MAALLPPFYQISLSGCDLGRGGMGGGTHYLSDFTTSFEGRGPDYQVEGVYVCVFTPIDRFFVYRTWLMGVSHPQLFHTWGLGNPSPISGEPMAQNFSYQLLIGICSP